MAVGAGVGVGVGVGVGAGDPHTLVADAVFRGVGAPVEKSALLLSVSVQPPTFRIAAVMLVSADVALTSEQFVPS